MGELVVVMFGGPFLCYGTVIGYNRRTLQTLARAAGVTGAGYLLHLLKYAYDDTTINHPESRDKDGQAARLRQTCDPVINALPTGLQWWPKNFGGIAVFFTYPFGVGMVAGASAFRFNQLIQFSVKAIRKR